MTLGTQTARRNYMRMVGKKLKRRRTANQQTLSDVARLAGVSITSVHRAEQGCNIGLACYIAIIVALGYESMDDAIPPI